LTTDKGIVVAQASFKSFQQATLAAIQSGALTGSAKAKAIDLVNQGQVIENRIYSTRNATDVNLLLDIVTQLSALGIKGI
jgi:co-chaperonin GroES (HSP10)